MNSSDFCDWVKEIAQSFDIDPLPEPLPRSQVVVDVVNLVVGNASQRFSTPKALIVDRVNECLDRLDNQPTADLSLVLTLVNDNIPCNKNDGDDDEDGKKKEGGGGDDEEEEEKNNRLSNDALTTFRSLANMLICVLLHAPTPAVYSRCRALLARYSMPFENELQHHQLMIDAMFEHSDAHLGYTFYELLRNLADLYARNAHETLPLVDGFAMTYSQLVDYAQLLSRPSQGQRMIQAQDYGRIIAIVNWQQRIEESSQHELRALIERASPGSVRGALQKNTMTVLEALSSSSSVPASTSFNAGISGAAGASGSGGSVGARRVVRSDGSSTAGKDDFDNDVEVALRALALLFDDDDDGNDALIGYTWPSDGVEKTVKYRLPLLGVWHRSAANNAPVIEQALDSLVGHQRDASGFDMCISHYLFAIVNSDKEVAKAGCSTGIEIELLTGPLRGLRVDSIAQLVEAYGGLTVEEKYAWQNGAWNITDSMEVVLPCKSGGGGGGGGTKNGNVVGGGAKWRPIDTILNRLPAYYLQRGGPEKMSKLSFDTDRLFAEQQQPVAAKISGDHLFVANANAPCAYDALPIGRAMAQKLYAAQYDSKNSKAQANGDKSKLRRIKLYRDGFENCDELARTMIESPK